MGQDHLHVAEILVENGADVNYRNKVRALHKYNIILCIMWPMIINWGHGIMVNQWDVQGMSNKCAACAIYSYIADMHTLWFNNEILSESLSVSYSQRFPLITVVRTVFIWVFL